ncbi:hypothetical protein C0993_006522 [Termitomyces sp. T159_Od127]|nr:hypothetical protein C0993_006522 [Termitomyces sp. T159_Od127]
MSAQPRLISTSGSSMASEFPAWLRKHSNDHYIASILRSLATRERQREIARTASWQPSFATERGTRSPLSRIYGMVKPDEPTSAESRMHAHYSVAVGIDPANQYRNRYGDIHPYDRTRVVVAADTNAGERYLNASWVLEHSGRKWWIASQAPLPHTMHTFLSLLLQPLSSRHDISRIRTIVQLTSDVEGGRRKAHPYYPAQVGQNILISPEDGDNSPPLIVTLKKREEIEDAHCVWSTLSLMPVTSNAAHLGNGSSHDSNWKEQHPIIFNHLLYTSWPDHGVPRDRDQASLLAFVKLVDKTNRNTSFIGQSVDTMLDPDPPIIVHCSAGIGRTGSFIAISSLLRKFGFLPRPQRPCPASVLPQSPLGDMSLEQSNDLVVQEIDSLREQRPGMVQRDEQVEYLGINFIDAYYRKGVYPFKEFPAVLGKETAGTIVALPTDEVVLNDETYKKNGYKVGGKVAADFLGTHATYISVPWKFVYPVPDNVSTRTAAAGTLQGLTAYTFFEEAYKVKKGDKILVHTVAGGLGLLMAQLGRARGAIVIGTTSTPEKAELAKQNGAAHVILYKDEDTVARVLEITNGEGVECVFDGVGKDTFDNNFKLIKRKGTIVSVGNASGTVPPFSPLRLVEKNVALLRPTYASILSVYQSKLTCIDRREANYTYTPEEAYHYGKKVYELIGDGTLKINIFKEYPFTAEGVREAQSDLVGGKTTGKLVVKVTGD